ncbi:MAG: hypothetical protein ABI040_10685 [Rhodoferax sp.]
MKHCTQGIGIWPRASNDQGTAPDVVMACAGEVPTLETIAAVALLRGHLSDLKIRVVNVVDLMGLQPHSEHPHGMSDCDFNGLFTRDKPVVFVFHGYPWLIHLPDLSPHQPRQPPRAGSKEEGAITTPFNMTVLNDMDRFHLAVDVIDRVRQAGEHDQDTPEIHNWKWEPSLAQ